MAKQPFDSIGIITYIFVTMLALIPIEAVLISFHFRLRSQTHLSPFLPYFIRKFWKVDVPTTWCRVAFDLILIVSTAGMVKRAWRAKPSPWGPILLVWVGFAMLITGTVEVILASLLKSYLNNVLCETRMDISTSAIPLQSLGRSPALEHLQRFKFPIPGVLPNPDLTPEQALLCDDVRISVAASRASSSIERARVWALPKLGKLDKTRARLKPAQVSSTKLSHPPAASGPRVPRMTQLHSLTNSV